LGERAAARRNAHVVSKGAAVGPESYRTLAADVVERAGGADVGVVVRQGDEHGEPGGDKFDRAASTLDNQCYV
jgi:hypothetical protein